MEVIAAAALLVLICAWWIVQVRARQQAKKTAPQRPADDFPAILASLSPDPAPEDTSHSEPGGTAERKPMRLYAEIVEPSGGVREISAQEVSALFRPFQTRLASLRKTAVNSTRVAQTFAQSGGPTPVVENYRNAHGEAATLTVEADRLIDTILFENEADLNKYQELLDQIVDVEMEIEDSLILIKQVESDIASGAFLPIKRLSLARARR